MFGDGYVVYPIHEWFEYGETLYYFVVDGHVGGL